MSFVEPIDDPILLSVTDTTDVAFRHFSMSFMNWLCANVEKSQKITNEISRDALEELVRALRTECQALQVSLLPKHSKSKTIPLQQYVSLVGFGTLLPQDSEALQTERLKYDWQAEFSGENGVRLLDLLRAGENLFVLEQPDMSGVFAAAIQLIRSFPIEKRLGLYGRSAHGVPLDWIPRIEQLELLPGSKAGYFILAHEVEPCIVQSAFFTEDPNHDCLESIRTNPIASDISILILADTNPDSIERLRLIDPHPDRLIELYVRLDKLSGDPASAITDLMESEYSEVYRISSTTADPMFPHHRNDIRPTIFRWLKALLEDISSERFATWLMEPKGGWQSDPTLPTEILDLLYGFIDTESIRCRIRENAIAYFALPHDGTNNAFLSDVFLKRLMLSILSTPSIEDLPILCYGVSRGILQQELYFDSSLLERVEEKYDQDSSFREALPSLGVPQWPDPVGKMFWADILSMNGLNPSTQEIASIRNESDMEPNKLDLRYWLGEFPNDRGIASYRFVQHWPLVELGTDEANDELRRFFARSDFEDAVKLCVMAELIERGTILPGAVAEEAKRLASVARQILNDIRLALQSNGAEALQNLDLCASAVIVAGRIDNWWKALKHLVLILRHLNNPAVSSNLRPNPSTERGLGSIPKAFEFAVYRVMTDAEHEVLRRDMAIGLVDYLKPRRSGQRKRDLEKSNSRQDGYDPNLKEPDPVWREAYIRALKDLGVKQRAPGKTFHGVLQKVAQVDPSEKVRTAAMDCDRELNNLRSAWASGSHKRLISHAWWWIKQAHLISKNLEINQKEANRTRVTEFR